MVTDYSLGHTITKRKRRSTEEASTQGPPAAETTRWARTDKDVKLMLRFQNGDEAAFEELVRRNTARVHALVYRFLGDQNQLDDLTQEVFLRVYRTVGRYQPRAKFTTWLYRIVANLSFNALRSRRKHSPRSLDSLQPGEEPVTHGRISESHQPGPSEGLDAAELRRQVTAAMSRLPDNQRMAIVLNKYEGKNYQEIAEILNCSTMAVKSLLSRARENLRAALAGYFEQG